MSSKNTTFDSSKLAATTGFDPNDEKPVWRSEPFIGDGRIFNYELLDFIKTHPMLKQNFSKGHPMTGGGYCFKNRLFGHMNIISPKAPYINDQNPIGFHIYNVAENAFVIDVYPDFLYLDFYNYRPANKEDKYNQLRDMFHETVRHMHKVTRARLPKSPSRPFDALTPKDEAIIFATLLCMFIAFILHAIITNCSKI